MGGRIDRVIGCIFHAHGADFEPEAYLVANPWPGARAYARERRLQKTGRLLPGGVGFDVSDGGDLERDIHEAVAFALAERGRLEALARWPGVDVLELDFGISVTRTPTNPLFDTVNVVFDPEAMQVFAACGLRAHVSLYVDAVISRSG